MTATLTIALELIATGIPVFPCRADKRPACAHGHKDASLDPRWIRQLWALAGPAAVLVGVPTGAASGIDALDVDTRNRGHWWELEHARRMWETRIHRTGSGGRHWLFRHQPGVRNSASRIAPGIDVRGEGGYVIWWPVLHQAPIAPWPDWLLPLVLQAVESPPPPTELHGTAVPAEISDARIRGIIQALLDNVRRAVDGQKHYTLRSNGISLGGYLHLVGWTEEQAVEQLVVALPAARDWALARRTAAWAIAQGARRPQTLPDRPRAGGRWAA